MKIEHAAPGSAAGTLEVDTHFCVFYSETTRVNSTLMFPEVCYGDLLASHVCRELNGQNPESLSLCSDPDLPTILYKGYTTPDLSESIN